jgi:hypothetical protein
MFSCGLVFGFPVSRAQTDKQLQGKEIEELSASEKQTRIAQLFQEGDQYRLQKNYDEAYKKLTTGNGNLVRASQKVKELGVKPNKSLPNALIERSSEE